ncbi:hypothetical protein ACLB2K_034476 [Fragaria x ananassa]
MKIKNKGKVHPSPSSSSSSSSSYGVVLSVFQLLPAAILALASVLSLEDREVLAYMITCSMKTAPSSSSSNPQDFKKKSSKKLTSKNNKNHQFDCECFDCYRSYWFRWDSSPNRELIHQAIEAFEDHLAHGEKPKKNAGRGKRRGDKTGRREAQKSAEGSSKDEIFVVAAPAAEEESVNVAVSLVPELVLPVCDVVSERVEEELGVEEEEAVEVKVEEDDVALIVRAAAVSNHKGLARKVLPDVLGLFNSRLWNLWSPNA